MGLPLLSGVGLSCGNQGCPVIPDTRGNFISECHRRQNRDYSATASGWAFSWPVAFFVVAFFVGDFLVEAFFEVAFFAAGFAGCVFFGRMPALASNSSKAKLQASESWSRSGTTSGVLTKPKSMLPS